MKITELINHLEELKKEHGDIDVFCIEGSYDWDELPVDKKRTEVRVVEDWEKSKAHLGVGGKYVFIQG